MAKPKSKTQKKIDGGICRALNGVCEESLVDVTGFQWLTHQANYTNFPASLLVTCVFDSVSHQEELESQNRLKMRIQAALLKIGVRFKSVHQQVVFDNEAACTDQDSGDWASRLLRGKGRTVRTNRPT